jgi:hypothetical protein
LPAGSQLLTGVFEVGEHSQHHHTDVGATNLVCRGRYDTRSLWAAQSFCTPNFSNARDRMIEEVRPPGDPDGTCDGLSYTVMVVTALLAVQDSVSHLIRCWPAYCRVMISGDDVVPQLPLSPLQTTDGHAGHARGDEDENSQIISIVTANTSDNRPSKLLCKHAENFERHLALP